MPGAKEPGIHETAIVLGRPKNRKPSAESDTHAPTHARHRRKRPAAHRIEHASYRVPSRIGVRHLRIDVTVFNALRTSVLYTLDSPLRIQEFWLCPHS
eukprot:6016875-Prymnesium_polylepis.1